MRLQCITFKFVVCIFTRLIGPHASFWFVLTLRVFSLRGSVSELMRPIWPFTASLLIYWRHSLKHHPELHYASEVLAEWRTHWLIESFNWWIPTDTGAEAQLRFTCNREREREHLVRKLYMCYVYFSIPSPLALHIHVQAAQNMTPHHTDLTSHLHSEKAITRASFW